MSNFFDDLFAPKTVFWKNHYWGGSEIDCFESIFWFLMQFCFQKHRSGIWDPKDMFSAPSGDSVLHLVTSFWEIWETKSFSNFPNEQHYMPSHTQEKQWRNHLWKLQFSLLEKQCFSSVHFSIQYFPVPQFWLLQTLQEVVDELTHHGQQSICLVNSHQLEHFPS